MARTADDGERAIDDAAHVIRFEDRGTQHEGITQDMATAV